MKIVVLSDTHIPRVAADLPAMVYDDIKSADMIIHAGDFVEAELYQRLKKTKKITAVYGNMDGAELRRILKEKETIQAGNFKIGLVHGYGAPTQLMDTVAKEFSGVDAIVFGHSHTATNITRNGVLFFNPGSPTDNIFATKNSYGILEIDDNDIKGRIIQL